MRIQRVRAHLNNGDVVDLEIETENIGDWFNDVLARGIRTGDKYIPHHSIIYIVTEPETVQELV